jgi:hypothetical protein
MHVREEIEKQLQVMSDDQLRQVAEYLSFVRYRSRIRSAPQLDEARVAALYAEFGEEDRQLAEEGLGDYVEGLTREDGR